MSKPHRAQTYGNQGVFDSLQRMSDHFFGDDEPMTRGNPPSRLAARSNAKTRVAMERERQIKLWGNGPMPIELRLAVLVEEVGEVAKAMQDETDRELLEELVQVGAVALRWAEDLLLEMER